MSADVIMVAAAGLYVGSTILAYRILVARVDRFAWHSHEDYFCFPRPCGQCNSLLLPMAALWPVTVAWLLYLHTVVIPICETVDELTQIGSEW